MTRQRWKFTAEFKAWVVLEMLTEQKSAAQASREYGIKDSVLSRWKQEFIEQSPMLFEQDGAAQYDRDQRISELERMVGRLAMELDLAKKSITVLELEPRRKRELVGMLSKEETFSVAVVSKILGLPRSTFYYQPKQVRESQNEQLC